MKKVKTLTLTNQSRADSDLWREIILPQRYAEACARMSRGNH